jgi:hypothetical protein
MTFENWFYLALGVVVTAAAQAIEYQLLDPVRHQSYWEKAIDNARAINAQVERIADTIRTRISVARVA